MRTSFLICYGILSLAGFALSGCQSSDLDPNADSIFSEGVFGDLSPKDSKRNSESSTFSTGTLRRPGDRRSADNFQPDSVGLAPLDTSDVSTAGQYTLNFENTDVKEVVRAVLNDALKLNYTISGDVSGPVTISSARPVSREALLAALEASLSTFGFSLTKSGDGYRVAKAGNDVGTVDRGRTTTAGYGVSIIPLRFVSAPAMVELLNGFVAQADGLRIDTSRNSIIARGTGPQRAQVVEAVSSFDSDFMQSQRVSIFRMVQARPADVIPELERIFNVKGENGLIQFRAVDRVRGIMAISKNAALIRRAENWVRRLDQQDADTGQNVVVYKAKYRKAEELAGVMNNLFGGGSETAAKTTQPPAEQSDAEASQADQPDTQDDKAGQVTNRVASAFGDQATLDKNMNIDTGPNVLDLTSSVTQTNGLRISADPANNSVVIYGDTERVSQILATLKRLDSTPIQVAINVTIAEVRLTKDLKYGVQYYLKSGKLGLGRDRGSLSFINPAGATPQRQTPGLNFVVGSDANPDLIISALDVLTDVEILSSPSLVVIENQTATLQVGDEVPITTQQSQSVENGLAPVINQVEFKETGIILNVTPRISQNDAITMEIVQEISNVASGANTLTPTISKRSIKTQISVNDQQTVLLGGLISNTSQNTKSGVPGLMNVPVLGKMFSTNSKSKGRTELIVLIRPVIIRDAQDAANVAESLRSQMTTLQGRIKK